MTNAVWCINSSIYTWFTRASTKPCHKRHEWKGRNGLASRMAYLQSILYIETLLRVWLNARYSIFSLFYLISLYNVMVQCMKLCSDVETILWTNCKGVSTTQNYLNLIIILLIRDSSLNIKLFNDKFSNKILLVIHKFYKQKFTI